MIEVRLGKPLYAVLAARVRIAAVANWSTTNAGPLPNTARPICAITVRSWLGYGRRWWASTDTPMNKVPRSTPIHTSVAAAFFDSGRRKAGTPLEIASTPVSATAPDENPFSSRKIPREPPLWRVPSNALGSNGTGAMSPKNACASPMTINALRIAM
jgi:hypothetical protein